MIKGSALLDIDQVYHLTGLAPATLRNWEKRYGFPKPQRSTGGHRLYEMVAVQQLRDIAAMCGQGIKVRDAIGKILDGMPVAQELSLSFTPTQTLSDSMAKIVMALYRYDAAGAEELLSRVGMRLTETDLLEMVYPHLLKQVGVDWEQSRINVAQEHFAWNYLRMHLLSYFKSRRSGTQGPRALLATLPGERHEGGLLILAAYMMLMGWQVYYLGADLPIEDIHQASLTIDPDVICISAISASTVLQNFSSLENLERVVAIGGACVAELFGDNLPASTRIFSVSGSLQSVIAHIELLIQLSVKSIKIGS